MTLWIDREETKPPWTRWAHFSKRNGQRLRKAAQYARVSIKHPGFHSLFANSYTRTALGGPTGVDPSCRIRGVVIPKPWTRGCKMSMIFIMMSYAPPVESSLRLALRD